MNILKKYTEIAEVLQVMIRAKKFQRRGHTQGTGESADKSKRDVKRLRVASGGAHLPIFIAA
jgi:hypothetical protein